MKMSRLTHTFNSPIYFLLSPPYMLNSLHRVMKINFTLVAQKEEEDLQRWKEANRTTVVQLNPQKLGNQHTEHLITVISSAKSSPTVYSTLFLHCYAHACLLICWYVMICFLMHPGGDVTLTEARQNQFTDLRTSKLQKKVPKYTFTVAAVCVSFLLNMCL